MEKVMYNGMEIDKVEFDMIMSQKRFNSFDIKRDFAPMSDEELTSIEVDELVKIYKDTRDEDKKIELEEEIFRANFNQMYYFACQNTYYKQGFNEDDVVSCMFMAHRYLLGKFEFKAYYRKGIKTDSMVAFRWYLKQYFKAKFHRYFVEGATGFATNTSLSNFKSRVLAKESIMCDNVDSDTNKESISDYYTDSMIEKIEVSDVDIKKELVNEIMNSLDKEIAKSVLINFKLMSKGANRNSKELIEHQCNIGLKKLKNNRKILELFKYYTQYIV